MKNIENMRNYIVTAESYKPQKLKRSKRYGINSNRKIPSLDMSVTADMAKKSNDEYKRVLKQWAKSEDIGHMLDMEL